jgi:hypothetical protein
MRCLLGILLALAAPGTWCAAQAQAGSDTLPKQVVSRAYDAFNRHDPLGFLSFFAPVWYHRILADTAAPPRRQVEDENIRDFLAMKVFAAKPTIRVTRRMVVGPYVIDEQIRGPDGSRHLDIFEVREGKIVQEWESGPLPSTR